MTPEMFAKIKRSLILHEGYKNFPYVDTVGKTTIGIGYNLSDRGLDDDWINSQFKQDVDYFYDKLSQDFKWFVELNLDRQIVLIDMCFMGYQKFLAFKKLINALAKNDFDKAANEMLNSKWATQVGERALQLAKAMRSGIYKL